MNVAAVVRETLLLQRASRCSHQWLPYSATEEQCALCTVIATADGKVALEKMKRTRRADPAPTVAPKETP